MPDNVQTAIRNVLGGDVDAYTEVVRAHQEEVWRIAAFAVRDVEATEDLVQQVFVQAYRSLADFDTRRDFGRWLRSIARNVVRNEIRRTMRERKALTSYREHLADRLADDEASEDHESRLHAALEHCREKLNDAAGRALDLRYAQSLGFTAVAESLGRTVAATRQLLQRVRTSLRRCIQERTATR